MIKFSPTIESKTQGVIILLSEDQIKKKSLTFIPKTILKDIKNAILSGQFTGKEKQLFPCATKNKIIILAGVGKEDKLSFTSLRISIRRALLSSFFQKIKDHIHARLDD